MLYKVSSPRSKMTILPSTFWHTPDWESSTTRARPGYIKDTVLYAGDFDEVNIHLLPKIRRMRFWRSLEVLGFLAEFSLIYPDTAKAVMVADSCNMDQVASFRPTIYTFDSAGFRHVRNGEFISRNPQTALDTETIPFIEAMKRWQFQVFYTTQYEDIAERARSLEIYFDEQT